eukprot:GEMP01038393.1.p1 GENE.GEMP01038393.1~~GEMP01038393.1.p1  ORF type:complete len:422 (+),score=51.76 GEMP01038393.1:104-1369(+)
MDEDNDGIETVPAASRWHSEWLQQFRVNVFVFLEVPESSRAAKVVSILILLVIMTSICCFVLETVQEWQDMALWTTMEIFSTFVFTVEYVLRFWTSPVIGNMTYWDFFISPMNMLDFLAIMPWYMEAALKSADIKGLRVLRTVRLIRLFRVFKLGRYNRGMVLMTSAVQNSVQALTILLFFLCIGVILFSSLLFYAERFWCPRTADWSETRMTRYQADCHLSATGWTTNQDAELCCDEYGNQVQYPSIIHTMWWSIVTLTTVGFGDQVPRTFVGKCLGGISMLCGIMLISLPVAIVGSKFQEAYDDQIKTNDILKTAFGKCISSNNQLNLGNICRASSFLHKHRKHRIDQLREFVGTFHGSGDGKPRLREHMQEILRLLEEATELEDHMNTLKTKNQKVEQKIAKSLKFLLSHKRAPPPEG